MKFYVIERNVPDEPARTEFLTLAGQNLGEAPRCGSCGGYIGMLPLLPPIRVELETWGDRPGDIAFGAGSMEILVSDLFFKRFAHAGLTGLVEIAPVHVNRVKSHGRLIEPVPSYSCCGVARSWAAIDDELSGLERSVSVTCQECRLGGVIKRTKRITLESNTWSGEDIFIARGLPGVILATERVQQFCREDRINNCYLTPADEYGFDFYPSKNRGPNLR